MCLACRSVHNIFSGGFSHVADAYNGKLEIFNLKFTHETVAVHKQ